MHSPQYIYLLLTAISLAAAALDHNKPRRGYTNFWQTLVVVGLGYVLLIKGGFFSH